MNPNHDSKVPMHNIKEKKSPSCFPYLLFAIVLVGAFFRFYRLGERSVWFDEVITYEDARIPYTFWGRTHILYFTLVKFFLFFGHSEFWLRLTSALFGILGIVAVYHAGKAVFNDRRIGLLSALFIALSRIHIHFSQDARYYTGIFFFSALSLYLFANFLNKRSIVSLILLPIVGLGSFLIHPVTLVFTGILLAWIPFSLIVTRTGRAILKDGFIFLRAPFLRSGKEREKGKSKKTTDPGDSHGMLYALARKRILLLLFVIPLVLFGGWCGWKIAHIVMYYMKQIQWFKAKTVGVSPTFQFFFYDHFIYYGQLLRPTGLLGKYLLFYFILFSLVGYGRALVKHFSFTSFSLFCIGISFVLLFSVSIGQSYDAKYVFYLFPGHVICLMYGFVSLIDALCRMFSKRFKASPLFVTIPLYALFLLPHVYKDYLVIRSYYQWKDANIKGAVQYVSSRWEPNDTIAAYGLTQGAVRYYVERLGLPSSRYFQLKHEKGDGTRSIQILLKGAKENGNIWYIFGWPHDIPGRLKDWIEKNFELSLRLVNKPLEPQYDATLWKWKYKDRFLSDETQVDLAFSLTPIPEGSPDGRAGWMKSENEIYVFHTMDAVMSYIGPETDLPSSFSLNLLIDGKSVSLLTRQGDPSSAHLETVIPLTSGARKLEIQLKSPEQGKTGSSLAFRLRSTNVGKKFLYAVEYDSASSTYDIESKTEKDLSYVFAPYNSFTSYDLSLEESGQYLFNLKAKNDAPGPILYQIEMDDVPVGIVSFFKGDDSWDKKMFPVSLSGGRHILSIYFISDIYTGEQKKAGDNDSFISYISLEKIRTPGTIPDQRVAFPGDSLVPISQFIPGDRVSLTEQGGKGWQAVGLSNFRNDKIRESGKEFDCLYAEVPPDSPGGGFASPAIPVQPGQLIYFTIKGRSGDLGNHSANVLVEFRDRDLKKLGASWINAQGIWSDNPGTKFICFRQAPLGVQYIVIYLSVYPNSVRPYKIPGHVWFYDFQSDVKLTKTF
jgi:hypothetical protein